MLKPTQDKELKLAIETIISPHLFYGVKREKMVGKVGEIQLNAISESLLKDMESRGYHVGLPPDIEWALNSGDGTYRP